MAATLPDEEPCLRCGWRTTLVGGFCAKCSAEPEYGFDISALACAGHLTQREAAVMVFHLRGCTSRGIGECLGVSTHSARKALLRVVDKLNKTVGAEPLDRI